MGKGALGGGMTDWFVCISPPFTGQSGEVSSSSLSRRHPTYLLPTKSGRFHFHLKTIWLLMAEEPGLSPGSYSKGVGAVGELLPPKDGRDLVTLHTDELLTTLIPRLDTRLCNNVNYL